jgi:shikimate dehydrogenase
VTPEGLNATLAAMREDTELMGAGVTAPHGTVILPLLDGLGPEARAIGAVTTLSYRAGALVGWNTDAPAFLQALDDAQIDPGGRDVVIFGAGGAARSVAWAVRPLVHRIWVVSTQLEQARRLCQDLEIDAGGPMPIDSLTLILRKATLVVNATPVGSDGASLLFPIEWLRPNQFVIDLLYNPPLTPLVRGARSRGARAHNGLTMLLHQGLASFEIWTGAPAPEGAMRAALERAAVVGINE